MQNQPNNMYSNNLSDDTFTKKDMPDPFAVKINHVDINQSNIYDYNF
jgi:hypothetical protein